MFIKNSKLYDILKYLAQVAIPAVGSLYFALAQIWGIPGGAKLVGTLTVVDTFLGVLLHLNSNAYNNSDAKYDGSIDIYEDENKLKHVLNLNDDPEKLQEKSSVTFKVKKQQKK